MMKNITAQLARTGNNRRRILTTGIVMHWDGKDYETKGEDLAKAIASSYTRSSSFGKTIPYHIRVTREGEILQCLDLNDMIYHCHNDWKSIRTIAVCAEGMTPTEPQLAAMARVVGFLKSKYRFLKMVEGHQDAATVYVDCPGPQILGMLNKFNSVGSSPEIIMESLHKAGDLLKVTADPLNMRMEQGGQMVKIPTHRQLKKGEVVEAVGHAMKGTVNGKEYTFVDVLAHNPDESGWVAVNYVKLHKKAEVVQSQDKEQIKKDIINLVNKL